MFGQARDARLQLVAAVALARHRFIFLRGT